MKTTMLTNGVYTNFNAKVTDHRLYRIQSHVQTKTLFTSGSVVSELNK